MKFDEIKKINSDADLRLAEAYTRLAEAYVRLDEARDRLAKESAKLNESSARKELLNTVALSIIISIILIILAKMFN